MSAGSMQPSTPEHSPAPSAAAPITIVNTPFGKAAAADRAYWAILGGVALSVLALSRALTPDARGFGTHGQLGLPPCGFLFLTGLPCPACGLTTCFAHMARAEFGRALQVNALGVPLFLFVFALPLMAVWAAARKRAFFETFARMQLRGVCIAFASLALLHWLVRIVCVRLG
jgi:hypothetical protein